LPALKELKKRDLIDDNAFFSLVGGEPTILKEFPDLVEAARCKQFLMALDFGCRIWGIDKEFEYELLKFIKKVAWRVLCNSENKTFHRILAFLSCISIRGTVYICRLYNRLKFMLKIQQKKAV